MAVRKVKKTFEELITLPPQEPIKNWVILGLDPSLSRTGFATATGGDSEEWIRIGSLKPNDSSLPIWLRASMIAEAIRAQLLAAHTPNCGLVICMEVPTPRNDFLNVLSKIIHARLLPDLPDFLSVHVLQVNASTMRSNMALKATGDNKWENVRKSQEFADAKLYPGIDTDSCDAILFAKYGQWVASLLCGGTPDISPAVMLTLCENTQVTKGKGTRARTVTKGILHNPAYWYTYKRTQYSIMLKDATIPPKKRLEALTLTI